MAKFSLPHFMRALFLQADTPGKHTHGYPLRVHIATLFSVLIFLFGLALVSFQQIQASKLMLTASEAAIGRSSRQLESELNRAFSSMRLMVDMLAYKRSLYQSGTLAARLDNLPFLINTLSHSDAIASLYIGYENGDFFIISPLANNSALKASLAPPEHCAYVVGSITQEGERQSRFYFFDRNRQLIGEREAMRYRDYDPRRREWFELAGKAGGKLVISQVYQFQASQAFGATFARLAENKGAVVAADITMDAINGILSQVDVAPSAMLWLRNEHTQTIASYSKNPQFGTAMQAQIHEQASLARSGGHIFGVKGESWHAMQNPIQILDGKQFQLLIAVPETELLYGVEHIRWKSFLLATLILAGILPLIWWLALRVSRPLEKMTAETSAISHFRFETSTTRSSFITEIDELSAATSSMKDTLQRFLEIGSALASERDFNTLLASILSETSAIAQARGGILYLTGTEEGWLTPAQALWDGLMMTDINRIPAISNELRRYHPVLKAFNNGTISHIIEPIDFMTWFGALGETQSAISALAIPLKNRQNHTIGVLLLLEEETTKDGPLPPELIALMEAISGTAAITIETQRLIQEQQNLLEAFIQLIASAIDAKSPYTGGHCQRVPELAKLLAQAACDSRAAPWVSFSLGEEEWQALHIATWLHDCGKITTPEYVVDKATKLETIYDRIHEVRMRFEVLKRDAEIACWQAIAQGADAGAAHEKLSGELKILDEEFAFVASCNPGSEFMSPDKVEKLREIAQRTWLRTLDNRLGISRDELERHPPTAEALPVREPLLADKPEHLVPRGKFDYPDPDRKFNLKIPQALYNRGELYNLSVARGTLTQEERYKINEHIIQTIQLLGRLPLPRHLQQVPEIACGHHEKMDGSGYPQGLKRDEMSVLARIMAVADIFEALTAGDRPYKPGKTLSEALEIMARMKADHHIDPEIFNLFLESGVYLQYARRYMQPEQIDAIDIARLVSIQPRMHETS